MTSSVEFLVFYFQQSAALICNVQMSIETLNTRAHNSNPASPAQLTHSVSLSSLLDQIFQCFGFSRLFSKFVAMY